MNKIILKLGAFACLFIAVGFGIYLEDVRLVKKPVQLVKVISVRLNQDYQDEYNILIEDEGIRRKYVLVLTNSPETLYTTGDSVLDIEALLIARRRIGTPYVNKYSKEYYNDISFYFYLFTSFTLLLFITSWAVDRI